MKKKVEIQQTPMKTELYILQSNKQKLISTS